MIDKSIQRVIDKCIDEYRQSMVAASDKQYKKVLAEQKEVEDNKSKVLGVDDGQR
jgi:hypothetical protein